MGKKMTPLIGLGVPSLSTAKPSLQWSLSFRSLGGPLGSATAVIVVMDQDVADARNTIVERALERDCKFLMFLGDDVHVPENAMMAMWARDVDIVTGVYWTKTYPLTPYVWRGFQKGPYLDWKCGEFFEVDWAGCDCMMVKTEVFKKIKEPWFSRDWKYSEEQKRPSPIATEDLYFYGKAKEAGFKAWCDASIQCGHEDRTTGAIYGLSADMKQAGGWYDKDYKGKLIADIGAGQHTRSDLNGELIRFDIREDTNPDVRCDIRQIPEEDEKFDVVNVDNVLEHFDVAEAPELLEEWTRILKVGGELRIMVPNLQEAFGRIMQKQSFQYDWDCIWGKAHGIDEQYHKTGFMSWTLERLLNTIPWLKDVKVEVEKNLPNICATATKKKHKKTMILSPFFVEDKTVEGRLKKAREKNIVVKKPVLKKKSKPQKRKGKK